MCVASLLRERGSLLIPSCFNKNFKWIYFFYKVSTLLDGNGGSLVEDEVVLFNEFRQGLSLINHLFIKGMLKVLLLLIIVERARF